MADRLTQLQDAIDNQQTLMYAAINYIKTRHPYSEIFGQPNLAPDPVSNLQNDGVNAEPGGIRQGVNGDTGRQQPNGPAQAPANPFEPPSSPPPEERHTFEASLRELARDLVMQEQQIEYLINSLPGLGNSEASQMRRMRELEGELKQVEVERQRAEQERLRMIDVLGDILTKVKRVR